MKKARDIRTMERKARVTAIAMASNQRVLIGTNDGEIWNWDSRLTRYEHGTGWGHHSDAIRALATTEALLLSASNDGSLLLRDLATFKRLRELKGHRGPVTACALSADGKRALSGGEDHVLALWAIALGNRIAELRGHTGTVTGCAFVDDRLAVSASADGTLRLWELETGECIETFYGHSPWTGLSVRGRTVAASDRDGWGWVLELSSLKSSPRP